MTSSGRNRRGSMDSCIQSTKSPLNRTKNRSFAEAMDRERSISIAPKKVSINNAKVVTPRLTCTQHNSFEITAACERSHSYVRSSPKVDETDNQNDVKQWDMERMIELYFRDNHKKGDGSLRRSRSQSETNTDTPFVFPPSFTQKEGEQFMKKRFCRRNAVCIYDNEEFSHFLSNYVSTKHMMTFCI